MIHKISGADLYSMYVGEGEALLRNTFRRARLAAPSIIFFDEADIVGSKRQGLYTLFLKNPLECQCYLHVSCVIWSSLIISTFLDDSRIVFSRL